METTLFSNENKTTELLDFTNIYKNMFMVANMLYERMRVRFILPFIFPVLILLDQANSGDRIRFTIFPLL